MRKRKETGATMSDIQVWTFFIVALTFTLYMAIAFTSRVRDTSGFYVAGRGVPAIANGMATAADWMSAASFISMAGLISFTGYSGSVYLMGWTGGYVLLALLLAPYLRKFGKFTVPDFVGDRYYSHTARIVAVWVWFFVSFVLGIFLVEPLNEFKIKGFPLGFWFAQQGSIYIFVLLIIIYARRMDKIDRRYDVDEKVEGNGGQR